MVRANLLAGLGAAALTYAVSVLFGAEEWVFPVMSGLYIFAMQTLNRVMEGPTLALVNPVTGDLYVRRKFLLALLGMVAALGCVALSAGAGTGAFVIAAACCLLGVAYSGMALPVSHGTTLRYRRLRDIPGSKDVFVSLAWAALCVLLPAVALGVHRDLGFWAVFVVFVIVSILAFVRSVLYDVRDMQGDQMVGKETIPILIGKSSTKALLATLVGLSFAAVAACSWLGILPPAGYGILPGIVYVFGYLYLYHRRVIFQGISSEVVVESGFLVMAASVVAASRVLG